MALITSSYTFDLTEATLSGGARLASASGSLPQRITTEADRVFNDVIGTHSHAMFSFDSQHVWTLDYRVSANNLVKRNITSGSTAITVNTGVINLMGMCRSRDGTHFYVGGFATNNVYKYRDSDGALITTYASVGTNPGFVFDVPGGTANTFWVIQFNNATLREYSLSGSTATATGRTIVMGAVIKWACGVSVGGVAKIFVGDGSTVRRYNESNLNLDITWNPTLTGTAEVGDGLAGAFTAGVVQSDGKPQLYNTFTGVIDRWNSTGGSSAVGDKRIVWAGQRNESNSSTPSTSTHWRWAFDYSPDGRYMLFYTSSTGTANSFSVRVVNIQTQRARFERVFPVSFILLAVAAPGAYSRVFDANFDYRKITFWWSTNGGARTEFAPNETIFTLTSGTLAFDCDLNVYGKPAGIDNYISDGLGHGLTAVWPVNRIPRFGPPFSG